MSRIAPLVACAIFPLVALAVGCDDGAVPVTSGGTVAVGTLPAELPTPSSSGVATTEGTDGPATTTPETEPDVSSGSTDRTTSTDAGSTVPDSQPPTRTRLVEVLDRLVEGDIPTSVETASISDDTGRLRIDVPAAWSDHRTTPSRLPAGGETPSLAASPDLTSFLDGYDTPGLTALVVDGPPEDALAAYAFDGDCLSGRPTPYVGDGAVGSYEVWESCGGTFNDIVTIAVRPAGSAATVLLLVQLVGPEDLVALDAALDSLTLD